MVGAVDELEQRPRADREVRDCRRSLGWPRQRRLDQIARAEVPVVLDGHRVLRPPLQEDDPVLVGRAGEHAVSAGLGRGHILRRVPVGKTAAVPDGTL
ncbi:hypothetical protein BRD09_06710 [Halobacteriales archaeon SW_10_68_16]|nr:MAG: hypothetical protein BRD09_06710 [Halobacteriales archaeon SW_10_68_16]